MKKVINRGKRSKTLEKVKPVKIQLKIVEFSGDESRPKGSFA